MLREFEQINLIVLSLKSSENRKFSDDFWGDSS